MSDKSFENAMSQIASQAQAEQEAEQKAFRRQQLFGKIRGALVFLFGAALLGSGYYYRADLQNIAQKQFGSKPQIKGQTSQALNAIQANAAKRDKALDDLMK